MVSIYLYILIPVQISLYYKFVQLKGEMSSQVMLPMPAGVENIFHAEAKLRER